MKTYYEELELDIDPQVSPSLTLTVFVSEGEGEGGTALQQSATYEVEPCQEHRVTAGWSAEKLAPGSSVNLEISSDQNSLCAVSATDKVHFIFPCRISVIQLSAFSQSIYSGTRTRFPKRR